MQTFSSKRDTWLMVVIYMAVLFSAGCAVVTLVAGLTLANFMVAAVLLLVGAGLPLWVVGGTYYAIDTINEDSLKVHCGPFKWQIKLADIESVSATNNPISSPALSLDRLAIYYKANKQLIISPQDKAAFVEALNRPDITVS
ncbi:PH domain-containing protein [Alteromonas gilva]|uniref:PH domain-containing protein n=1 Tax=Alteromonas gilva TaxID=2987522 RepID=A0ABT5L2Q8_9ALTE|nr:PH domain-containing protein [Alteromonas gilva]MDC8831330.1 PH domain-containing protein [Alteromonas gilva]